MAKKDKDSKKAARADSPVADALRIAVEQAFAAKAAAGSGRIVDELTSAATRMRDVLDDSKLETQLAELSAQLGVLLERVENLEARVERAESAPPPAPRRSPAPRASASPRPKPAKASAGTKPAGTRSRATTTGRTTRPRKPSTPDPAPEASEGRS